MRKKKKTDVKKIYKTTDGIFTGRADIDKPRRVAAIEQRKDDGALAVVKIRSRKGKGGKSYITGLVLKPKVRKGVGGAAKQHKKTHKRKMRLWHRHFKK